MKFASVTLVCLIASVLGSIAASLSPSDPKCARFLSSYLASLDAGRNPEPLPIPSVSLPGSIREVGYNLQQIRTGVYSVHDGTYFSMVVLNDGHLVLIDFPDPPGSAASLRNTPIMALAAMEILNGTKPNRIDMVYSHSHFDHIGGATRTKEMLESKLGKMRFTVWASKGTLRSLLESGSSRAPLPSHVFERSTVLRVGRGYRSLPILLKVVGGHTEDDLLVYFRPQGKQKGIAFLVDVIFPGWGPGFYLAASQNLNQYIAVHDILLKLDFDVFIGGHFTKLGTKKDVAINKQYTLSVVAAAKNAIKEVTNAPPNTSIADPKSRSFGNFFLGGRIFFSTIERKCARAVIEAWGCRLAGVEQIAETNCVTARLYNQLDN